MRALVLLLLLVIGCARGGELGTRTLDWRTLHAEPPGAFSRRGAIALEMLNVPRKTKLGLEKLRARAVIRGPLAFTELELAFRQPDLRNVEVALTVPVPPGATVTRFAVRTGDTWREAELVDLVEMIGSSPTYLPPKAHPSICLRGSDNLLWTGFFPIWAGEQKQLVLSFIHELPNGVYRLPLAGIGELDELEIEVEAGRRYLLREKSLNVDRDFELAVDTPDSVQAGRFVAARVVRPLEQGREPIRSLTLLVDTSASRHRELERQARLVEDVARELARREPSATLDVVCFDQRTEIVYRGSARGFGREQRARITAREALGATDLGSALADLARLGVGKRRVAVMTDGIITAGPARGLADRVRAERFDVILLSKADARPELRALVETGKRHGAIIDAAPGAAAIVARLRSPVSELGALHVERARWHAPTALAVAPAEAAIVYAELERAATPVISVDGNVLPLKPTSAPQWLVERAASHARILDLPALGRHPVELSLQSRVLSPFTALLLRDDSQPVAKDEAPVCPDSPGIPRRPRRDTVLIERGVRIAWIFELGSSKLRPEHKVELDEIALALKSDPKIRKIELRGQIDPSERNESSDRQLDLERARAVADGLIARGIAPERIQVVAGGWSRAMPGDSPDIRRINARVDIRILEADLDPEFVYPNATPNRQLAPYEGVFAEVEGLLARSNARQASNVARRQRIREPNHPLAYVALGRSYERLGQTDRAARAYGSIADMTPYRADMRRAAGVWLQALAGDRPERARERALARSLYERALDPQNPKQWTQSTRRLLAYALLAEGRAEQAFETIAAGGVHRPSTSYDLGIVARA